MVVLPGVSHQQFADGSQSRLARASGRYAFVVFVVFWWVDGWGGSVHGCAKKIKKEARIRPHIYMHIHIHLSTKAGPLPLRALGGGLEAHGQDCGSLPRCAPLPAGI